MRSSTSAIHPQPTRDHYAIGVDVGGTKIGAGIVHFPSGQVIERRILPTSAPRGGEAVFADVLKLVGNLAQIMNQHAWTLEGIGVALCELVDHRGQILSASSFDWRGTQVRERLGEFGPTQLEADIRAATLSEIWFGLGRTLDCFLFVSIGTGISFNLVFGGNSWPGVHGIAGTFASSPLPGTRGIPGEIVPSLEQLASGTGLVARYASAGHPVTRAEEVAGAADAGDADAIRILRSGGESLGAAIGWWVNALDPGGVVLGGGLGLSSGLYHDSLIEALRNNIWSEHHRDLPVLRALLGPDAALVGAAGKACGWTGPVRACENNSNRGPVVEG